MENDNKNDGIDLASQQSKMPRLKVCGMTELGQLHELEDAGIDFAGFIFYPKSPRFVVPRLAGSALRNENLKIAKVGVFVNSTFEEIMSYVDEYGLDMVQLHGDETPFFVSKLSDRISVIKAFRITKGDQVEWKIKDYYTDTDMYMFDTDGAGYGGTGRKFNWEKLKGVDIQKPFFLSGGIEPSDVENIKEFLAEPVAKDLFSLDLNSKFEISPGVKDMDKVRSFVKNLSNP